MPNANISRASPAGANKPQGAYARDKSDLVALSWCTLSHFQQEARTTVFVVRVLSARWLHDRVVAMATEKTRTAESAVRATHSLWDETVAKHGRPAREG